MIEHCKYRFSFFVITSPPFCVIANEVKQSQLQHILKTASIALIGLFRSDYAVLGLQLPPMNKETAGY